MGTCVASPSQKTEAPHANMQRDIQFSYYVASALAEDGKFVVLWRELTHDPLMLYIPSQSFPWSDAETTLARSLVTAIRSYLDLYVSPIQPLQNKLFLQITGDNFIHTHPSNREVHVQFSLSEGGGDHWHKVQV